MTKSGFFGAAAVLAAVIATPAMAQDAMQEPGAYAQDDPWANNYHDRYGPNGWPGVVGDAVGTADAIVTAPFRDRDSYAYHGEGRTYDDSYAYYGDRSVRTTCGPQPGASYLGPDGRWHPCN